MFRANNKKHQNNVNVIDFEQVNVCWDQLNIIQVVRYFN